MAALLKFSHKSNHNRIYLRCIVIVYYITRLCKLCKLFIQLPRSFQGPTDTLQVISLIYVMKVKSIIFKIKKSASCTSSFLSIFVLQYRYFSSPLMLFVIYFPLFFPLKCLSLLFNIVENYNECSVLKIGLHRI